jgi:predicted negative regulator of RcsB-dependent stress response
MSFSGECMSFDVLDEHEQGELVQKWLRENAMAIATGIGLGLVLIFGWQQWKVHRAGQDAAAAAQYQALTDAIEAKKPDDALKVADSLRKDYPGSTYAVLAALQQADIAIGKNDLSTAATTLDWARAHAGLDSLEALVALRSARVKLAQGDADAAIKLVDALPNGDYAALAGEVRGDALLKLGRADEARKAYQDALSQVADGAAQGRNVLQMKLDDLGGAATAAGVVVPAAPTAEKPAS